MSAPQWQLEFSRRAQRDLQRLPSDMQRRVADALDGLITTPREGDIKKIRGTDNEYRLRVGDWRVLYRPDPEHLVVVILTVAHRRDAYRE